MTIKQYNTPAALRQYLDGPALLRMYMQVTTHLLIGFKPVYDQPTGKASSLRDHDYFVVGWEPLTQVDIKRFEKVLSAIHRMINKLLPELKAVDVVDSRREDSMTATEKANRMVAALRQTENGDRILAALQPADDLLLPPMVPGLPASLVPASPRPPAPRPPSPPREPGPDYSFVPGPTDPTH